MKRQKIIEESDDSDEVNFPESIFNEGGEVGSDMDFEVGTIQSPPERCTFFVHYIFFILLFARRGYGPKYWTFMENLTTT